MELLSKNYVTDLISSNIKLWKYNISLTELFEIFVDNQKLINELTNYDKRLVIDPKISNILFNILIENKLSFLAIALKNINSSHILNILFEFISNDEINYTQMTYAIAIHFDPVCNNILLTYLSNNDKIFINSLLQNNLISSKIYNYLLILYDLPNGNNYVGLKILKLIQHYCDEDIRKYWFPLIKSEIIDALICRIYNFELC